jgi:hypothetical protein
MGYFRDPAEVDRYIGGILRLAASSPDIAVHLEAASATLRILCIEPDCELTVFLAEPIAIVFGPSRLPADVSFELTGDALDRYWRGDYSLLDGLATGEVRAMGPVSKILKVLPHVEELFPQYRELVASKDAS